MGNDVQLLRRRKRSKSWFLRLAVLLDNVVEEADAKFDVAERDALVVAVDAVVFSQRRQRGCKTIDLRAELDLKATVGANRVQEWQQYCLRDARAHLFLHQRPQLGFRRARLL